MPSGTVTFLFTDVEGSTRRWEEEPEIMRSARAVHDDLLTGAIELHGGHVVKGTGDGAFAVFADPHDGLRAAVEAQRAFVGADWPGGSELRVRMGLHMGPATEEGGDYFGPDVNRTARLMSIAHGGQVVCSRPVADLVGGDFTLVDHGEHRLRDLQSSVHVFQVAAEGLPAVFPPLRSLDAWPGNLPRQITAFVGRRAEIDSVSDLVQQLPLVTLTGVGGVGKTRLALQVAGGVLTEFPDGAWLCEFAPVTDPAGVWDALAASLRVQALLGRTLEESVLEYLASKRLLLILDNCEHLLDAAARLVTSIEQRAPDVAVLATSREGLALGGERIVAVPALGLPGDHTEVDAIISAEAVRLFADRAVSAKADFVIDDRNAGVVALLCQRLDGIPLALELAAARVRSLSPDDLVARLDQRFKLLTKGSRAALERHQTLRSTIDWSYQLLDLAERQALDRLSVFAGSCDLASAEAVLANEARDARDVADVLGQLVDKSLVVTVDDDSGGVRYKLLESIRQYAAERLEISGNTAVARRSHADYYVTLAETAGPHLRGPGQLVWAPRALREIDNFRAVLDWAIDTSSPDHALRLVAPFTVTNLAIGEAAQDWAAPAASISGAEVHPSFPIVAGFASVAAAFSGDLDQAQFWAEAGEATLDDRAARCLALLRARGVLAMYSLDRETTATYAVAWVEGARQSGDPSELAHALILLAAASSDDNDRAVAAVEESIGVAREHGVLSALGLGLSFLAGLIPVDKTDRQLELLDEAITVADQVGDRLSASMVGATRAFYRLVQEDWWTALEESADGIRQQMHSGYLANISGAIAGAAMAFTAVGEVEVAAVLRGSGVVATWNPYGGVVTQKRDEMVATILEALGPDQVAVLTARGRAMSYSETVTYLLANAERVLDGASER